MTLIESTLSNNKTPRTRGGELGDLLKEILKAIFELRVPYTAVINGSNSVIPKSVHKLNEVNNVRFEDLDGNEIDVPNRVDNATGSVYIYSDTSFQCRIKLS